jgi:hypothetical protein
VTVDRRDTAKLQTSFTTEIGSIDVQALISQFQHDFKEAIDSRDLELILEMFDQKGLLEFAATQLGLDSGKALVQQASRFMSDVKHQLFKQAVLSELPNIS